MARKVGIEAQAEGERNIAVVLGPHGFETQSYPGYNMKAFVPPMRRPSVPMSQDQPLGDRSERMKHGSHHDVGASRINPYGYDFGTGRR